MIRAKASYLTILVFLCSLGFAFTANAQSECDEDVDPKVYKLFEKGINRKKYNKGERLKYLRKALDENEDFVAANYAMAHEQLRTARAKGSSFNVVERYFEKVVQNCPEFHSEAYFYLGEIALGKMEYRKAVDYYQEFIDFSSENENAYAKDFDEQLSIVKSNLEYASFFADAFENPVPFDPKIVQKVSTEADEYLPLISPDGEYMFFTRKTEDDSKSMDQVFDSETKTYIEKFVRSKSYGDNFDAGQPLPAPFNEDDNSNYGGATISLDNKHLYFTMCKTYIPKGQLNPKPRKNCDIYASDYTYGLNPHNQKTEWHWSEIRNLGPNINTPDGWESQPSLSGDGKTLYFASWRADSKGIDIYFSNRRSDGSWSQAKNIGPPINTEKHDKSPFIHSDSRTLYFSSQGHKNFGGYDIFYTQHDDQWNWSEPKNVGYPINTDEDEHGFIVASNGRSVYYSSGKFKNTRGPLNILNFDLYKEARPNKVLLVKGKVDTDKPIKKAKVELKNMNTKEVQSFDVDSVDGSFAAIITVKDTEEVVMNLKGDDIGFQSKLIKKDTNSLVARVDMEAKELKVGESYTINDIYYETSSADISRKSKLILDEFAQYLKENPGLRIAIYGHTDNVGDYKTNMSLSADRAFSVMAYLQEKGVGEERLSFKGFGPSKPVASNNTEEGRAKNRRTEFRVLGL